MAQFTFKLPDIGEGTAEAEIAEWRVKVGDAVEEDQPLVDMMTDKATVELTSPVRGRVLSLAGPAGGKAAVGSVLVTFELAEEKVALVVGPTLAAAPKSVDGEPPAGVAAPAQVSSSSTETVARSRVRAAPAVRRRAMDLGVELRLVSGSGTEGRVTHADLDRHVTGADTRNVAHPAVSEVIRYGEFSEVAIAGLRRQIAERMQLAKRQIPHFSYIEEVDVSALEDLRRSLNAGAVEGRPKLTLLPFLMRALTQALVDYPQLNATYDDERGVLRQFTPVHMGIATHTPRGLMVVVVRDAQSRDVWNSATEIARLATRARDGKATREELTGSTITITSLGALGGVATTPIINRPEVAIVGPNRIVERPVVIDTHVVARKMMHLSSSFDHRIVDGTYAAQFIQRVRELLEHPATLFIR